MRTLIPFIITIGYSITDILSNRKIVVCYYVLFLGNVFLMHNYLGQHTFMDKISCNVEFNLIIDSVAIKIISYLRSAEDKRKSIFFTLRKKLYFTVSLFGKLDMKVQIRFSVIQMYKNVSSWMKIICSSLIAKTWEDNCQNLNLIWKLVDMSILHFLHF